MNSTYKVYIITFICFIMGTSEFVIVGVLDKIAESTQVSISQAGQLITIFAITSAIGTPFLMQYLKTKNQQKVLMLSLLVFTIGCVAMIISDSYVLMLISRVIMAVGFGVFGVLAFIVAAKLSSPEKQASAIATVTIGYNAALIFGLPMGRYLTLLYGWKSIFWFAAVFGMISIAIIKRYIPPFEGEEAKPLREQLILMMKPKIQLGLFISFFWIVGYAVLYSYITPYLNTLNSFSEQVLSLTLLLFGISTLVGNKLGGYMGGKLGVANTVVFTMGANVLALICLSFFTGFTYLTIGLLVFWALAAWAPGPLLRYNIISLSAGSAGVILSLYNSTIQFGFASGAGLGGIVFDHFPVITLSWVAAGLVFVSLMLAILNSFGSRISSFLLKKKENHAF